MYRSSIIQMLKILPFRGDIDEMVEKQTGDDLITQLFAAHDFYKSDYDLIAKAYFYPDPVGRLWGLFKTFRFNAEPGEAQTMRSPYVILTSNSVDCKHYALFCGGILGSLKRSGYNIDWCYRFASYTNDPPATHVYVVINTNYGEFWIDPVFDSYLNQQNKKPILVVDKQTNDKMAIYRLSGPQTANNAIGTVTVAKKDAERAFLILINLNDSSFPLKQLLKNNANITNGAFRAWYISQGFDFQNLVNILNS